MSFNIGAAILSGLTEKLAISDALVNRLGSGRAKNVFNGSDADGKKLLRSIELSDARELRQKRKAAAQAAVMHHAPTKVTVTTATKSTAAAAKARGFRGPSLKQMGVGAGIAAGVGAALYARHRREREKTAAIPAARFKELRGQIAGRLAHRVDMVSNRLLDAHGSDLLRLRAQKRRLGGMLGRAQMHETKAGLRSAGVNTNVRNSAASLSAERSAVTGSTANAATKITRRPAPPAGGGMANDATKVVKTPPLPAATGGADHTRTGLGWHLQKPKVRAA
jgi:hypothetical protein